MTTHRMIEFETTTDEGARRVTAALEASFAALDEARPSGVGLGYWRVRGSRRFFALIELADEDANPLLHLGATQALPAVIGAEVEGGYPRPDVADLVGSYGLGETGTGA